MSTLVTVNAVQLLLDELVQTIIITDPIEQVTRPDLLHERIKGCCSLQARQKVEHWILCPFSRARRAAVIRPLSLPLLKNLAQRPGTGARDKGPIATARLCGDREPLKEGPGSPIPPRESPGNPKGIHRVSQGILKDSLSIPWGIRRDSQWNP